MGFSRLFGLSPRLFSDFWGPRVRRLFRDFFQTFGVSARRLLLPGRGDPNPRLRTPAVTVTFDWFTLILSVILLGGRPLHKMRTLRAHLEVNLDWGLKRPPKKKTHKQKFHGMSFRPWLRCPNHKIAIAAISNRKTITAI